MELYLLSWLPLSGKNVQMLFKRLTTVKIKILRNNGSTKKFVVDFKARFRTILAANESFYVKFPAHRMYFYIEKIGNKKYRLQAFEIFLQRKNSLYAAQLPNANGSCIGKAINGKSITDVIEKTIDRFWQAKYSRVPNHFKKFWREHKKIEFLRFIARKAKGKVANTEKIEKEWKFKKWEPVEPAMPIQFWAQAVRADAARRAGRGN